MCIYYVYAYIRKSDNTPYYIGKGKGRRAYAKHHAISVPKDKTKIVFLEQCLTNVGACAIERKMITWYGRKDMGTGILLNRTDGGEGTANRVCSENTKHKISTGNLGKKHSAEQRANNSARQLGKKKVPCKEETKIKIAEKVKGYKHTELAKHKISKSKIDVLLGPQTSNHKQKLSKALQGKPQKKFQCIHCMKIVGGLVNLIRWHNDKCSLR